MDNKNVAFFLLSKGRNILDLGWVDGEEGTRAYYHESCEVVRSKIFLLI